MNDKITSHPPGTGGVGLHSPIDPPAGAKPSGKLQTLQWVLEAMELKTTAIARLKRVLFGFKSEKTKQIFPEPTSAATGATPTDPATPPGQRPKRRGHGRRSAQTYTGAQWVAVPHP